MLDIAKQHKGFVSEVVFCERQESTILLTYYSSECEVEFCGHGTIACMYSLIKETPALLDQKEITIQTSRKGALTVYNRIAVQNAVLITAPEPAHIGTQLDRAAISSSLCVSPCAISSAAPIDLIDAGLRTLIVPMCDLATETSVFPPEYELRNFCIQNDIDIILIFSMETRGAGHLAHTRVFAPRFGYLEDPATGSGNSAFGYYMLKNGLWDKSDCIIEQGGNDRVFNRIRLSLMNGKVLFGGSATTRIGGVYYV
jgi:PhzF family phenazine biosynthesis protein